MALTNNLKPSGFQPVGGGELLYKWTESVLTGKTNYRVVLQFNGYTSVLPDFEFRPDATGIVWADIAPILRDLLVFDETTGRMINTYVKYQAKWDESSDAQVNLSGDVIYAYVGNNHYLNNRTKFDIRTGDSNADPTLSTGVFLLDKTTIKPISGRKLYIDFLVDGTLPSNSRFLAYDGTGNIVNTPFDGTVKGLQSFDVTPSILGTQKDFTIWISNNAATVFYASIYATIEEECDNAVWVRWLNDFGGLQQHMFDYNQRLGFDIGSNDKAKYIDVAIEGLTFDEFLMFDELNKNGIVYNENYKQGQFVEDVTDYSNPVSLVVIPQSLDTFTKRVGHTFRTSFRYPLIPNTDV